MFTEDGTMIVEVDDLVDWAVQNYQSLMVAQLEKLYQSKSGMMSKVNCWMGIYFSVVCISFLSSVSAKVIRLSNRNISCRRLYRVDQSEMAHDG